MCANHSRRGNLKKWDTIQRMKILLQSSWNLRAPTARINCMSYDDVESTLSTLPDLKEDTHSPTEYMLTSVECPSSLRIAYFSSGKACCCQTKFSLAFLTGGKCSCVFHYASIHSIHSHCVVLNFCLLSQKVLNCGEEQDLLSSLHRSDRLSMDPYLLLCDLCRIS